MKLSLDNSALSNLACKRRFQLTVVDGLFTPINTSLEFGSAFHTAIEYLDKGIDVDTAIADTFTKYPNVDKLLLVQTVSLFKASVKLPPPIELESGPAVEVKFSFPYRSVITSLGETVDIDLCGTIDRMCHDEQKDQLVILDYKTAGDVTDYKIKAKIAEYDLSFQLPFYAFSALNSGLLPAKWKAYIESNKYRVEIMFAFYAASPPRFKVLQKPAFNDDFLRREVPLIINNRILEAVNIISLNNKPAPHDGMNIYKYCSNCPFKVACLVMGTAREDELLSRYDRKPYNPLLFR